MVVVGGCRLVNPPITDCRISLRACCQTFDRRWRRMKSLLYECHQGLVFKRFGEKWEVAPAYAVPCQILIDVAGHENDSQVFPYVECADGQLVAVDMGKLIGA